MTTTSTTIVATTKTASVPIISAENIRKVYPTPDGGEHCVLDGVSVDLREGEIVALLGKSGSGKSTLLRCIAGLAAPTSGVVRYRGERLRAANPGVGMVFQTFALMPWLTVQQNVELGLEAHGVTPAERRERALRAIDLIGLDGYESAYPRELSGGMRQRVGFARALVVEPDALLMDEPFSALDVLTSENLRSELLRLWAGSDMPTQAVLIVTHNIEEAIQLADRVLVLSSNPGRVKAEINIRLPRPRDRRSPEFERHVDDVYGILTGHAPEGVPIPAQGRLSPAPTHADTRIPHASVSGMSGLVQIVHARGGQAGLADLAEELLFEVDDLLPLVDFAVLLRLLEVRGASVRVTAEGREYARSDILAAKEMFARLVRERVPLVKTICTALAAVPDGKLRRNFFVDLLRRSFSEEEANVQLDIAIGWGRHGELFEYDADTRQLTLDVGGHAGHERRGEGPHGAVGGSGQTR